ncbi:calcium/sodium antiporter [Limnochorda pilosa]|uniref:K+dependent Na+ exchanger related-protein n=1 Tax=Limnochorda pilosa TaxID=1555112 RepID=A0A0K2SGE0_LIMPI|nr:calcium/sodium antiporter [Limnochorda pilosa]BAS25919.1 K+dependent Na+ exchanger related-protein [Limnochorda pilosa]
MEPVTIVLFALGIVAITKGGDWFADGAVWFAAYSGLPKVLIGATLVSIATTLPEFTVSFIAAWSGATDTAVGNAVGSTIANIGLILAGAALIQPVLAESRAFRVNGALMVLAAGLVLLIGRDGALTAGDGVLLLVAAVGYLAYQARSAGKLRRANQQDPSGAVSVPDRPSRAELPRNLGVFLLGGLLVVGGSRLVVSNGVALARMLGVSELVIALTLVSVGTSLPELVTAITSARKGHSDLSAGNIIGANILDLTWVLAGASLVRPLPMGSQVLRVDLPVSLLFMSLILLAFTSRRHVLGRGLAAGMLGAYGLYVAYLVRTGSLGPLSG